MSSFQDAVESLYFKLVLIDRHYKDSFINGSLQDCSININKHICNDIVDSIDVCIENIYYKYLESRSDMVCLYNFEILFRPEYRFDLLSYLKEKSKTKKIAIIWPGEIQNDQLVYSRPGRSDYYTHKIDNYLIHKEKQ